MDSISEDGDFTDFTLESEDGTKFPCHQIVLAAQSSVLKRMFLSPFEEKKTSSLQLQYKADIVRKFVKFFYKREIEKEEKSEASGRAVLSSSPAQLQVPGGLRCWRWRWWSTAGTIRGLQVCTTEDRGGFE